MTDEIEDTKVEAEPGFDPEKIVLDRLHDEDLQDVFSKAFASVLDKANDAIEDAEDQINDYREKLDESRSACEDLDEENKKLESTINDLKETAGKKIDFEAVERLINFAPGDPGKLYPLHERVAAVIAKANTDRDDTIASRNAEWDTAKNVAAELAELKAAIIPELERLEGHEKRLREIVELSVKDKRLAGLLRDARNAF